MWCTTITIIMTARVRMPSQCKRELTMLMTLRVTTYTRPAGSLHPSVIQRADQSDMANSCHVVPRCWCCCVCCGGRAVSADVLADEGGGARVSPQMRKAPDVLVPWRTPLGTTPCESPACMCACVCVACVCVCEHVWADGFVDACVSGAVHALVWVLNVASCAMGGCTGCCAATFCPCCFATHLRSAVVAGRKDKYGRGLPCQAVHLDV